MSGNEGEALKLLPQDQSEFASKSYWDGFFNKLKKNDGPKEQRKKHPHTGGSVVKPPGEEEDSAFEWYGEWPDIDKVVLANSDVDKQVLVVGCGNSQLSEQMSEAGFMIVTSIDFSQVVIDEMKAKTQGKMGLQFLFMDMLNMDPEWDERFGTVVDKGTLDALLADDKPETLARSVNMLEEVIRVLETGGMYFCVTLAQDHVRKLLLEQFPLGSNFDVSLYAFEPKMGSVLQPFLFAIRKRDSPGTWKLYMEPGQDSHTTVSENVDAITEAIDDRRLVYHMRGKLKSTSGVGLKAKFALWGENSAAETPRYLVSVVDSGLPTARQSLPCGVFLPPQGREHEWMFATEDGQVKLAQSNGIGRLIVASMERGHSFDTIQAVQAELNPAMDSLFPPGLDTSKFQVPYLTAGEDLGSRNVLHTTGSSESGELSIEEVVEKDHVLGRDFVHRRLIFVNNACAVQSEARMMNNANKSAHGGKSKSKGGKKKKKSKAESGSGSTTKVVDSRYLAFEFHRAMIAALFMLRKHDSTTKPGVSTLVVGLGSGALAGYLATQLGWLREPVTVDAVELDPTVIDVATKWFDFGQVADKVNVMVQEGVSFLREPSSGRSKYTCVFVDVDSKDLTQPVLFPPLSFLEEDLLIHLKESVLDEHRGMLVLNLACKSEPKLEEMLGRIRGVYENVLCIPLTEFGDCNYVVIASVQSVPDAKKQVTEGKKRAYELAQTHNNGNPCAAFPHDFEEVLGDCKVVMETGKIQVL